MCSTGGRRGRQDATAQEDQRYGYPYHVRKSLWTAWRMVHFRRLMQLRNHAAQLMFPTYLRLLRCDVARTVYMPRPNVDQKHTVRLWLRLLLAATVCAVLATIAIAERALRTPGRTTPAEASAADLLESTGARLDAVELRAADGILLRAWLFTPRAANGAAVIALHGVGATRLELLTRAQLLLDAGYAVLTPDSRAHGGTKAARRVTACLRWMICGAGPASF